MRKEKKMTEEEKKQKARDERKKGIKIGVKASVIVFICFNGVIGLIYSIASIILGNNLFLEWTSSIVELEVHAIVWATLIGIGSYYYNKTLKPFVGLIKSFL